MASIFSAKSLAYTNWNKLFPKIDQNGRRYTTVPIHAPGESSSGKSSKSFKGMKPPKGRHWRTDPKILDQWDKKGLLEWSKNNNPRKKLYYDESTGKRITDIWNFKDPQYPIYPTEKNLEMLKLIIKTSSNKGSIILDCFSGSGSSLYAAHTLKRKWIGVDNSTLAIDVCKKRFTEKKSILGTRNFAFLNLNSKKNKSKIKMIKS